MTTINYGVSASISRDFSNQTVGDVLKDPAVLGLLDAPEGCSAVSDGRVLSNDELVSSVPYLTIEKRAAEKATA